MFTGVAGALSESTAGSGHPLWTDYVSAIGALVGILVALVALRVAARSARDSRRSAKDSKRSADYAEKIAKASVEALEAATAQLALARTEHERLEAERGRRPAVAEIVLSPVVPKPGEEMPLGIFRIGFTNSGDRPLRDALLTVLFDPGSAAQLVTRWGQVEQDRSHDETYERWPGPQGVPRAFEYFVQAVEVAEGVSRLQYVCFPRRGRFPVRVKLFSARLEGSGCWIDRWIDVDTGSGRASVVDLPAAGTHAPYAGRMAELAAQEQ